MSSVIQILNSPVFNIISPHISSIECEMVHSVLFLDSNKLLIILTTRQYQIHHILSQDQTKIQFKGKLDHQLADSFNILNFALKKSTNQKNVLIFLVDNQLVLYDIYKNQRITQDYFTYLDNTQTQTSVYDQQYKYLIVNQGQNHFDEDLIILFWKISTLKNSRQVDYQLKLLSLKYVYNQSTKFTKKSQIISKQTQKIIDLLNKFNNNQLKNENNNSLLKQENIQNQKVFQFQPYYKNVKKLKILSTIDKNLSFTYGFGHPISYIIQGHNIQISILSNKTGQTLRKFNLNSIFYLLVKHVVIFHIFQNNKIYQKVLILTKHQQMNRQLNQNQEENQQDIQQTILDQIDKKLNFDQNFINDAIRLQNLNNIYFSKENYHQNDQNPQINTNDDERVDVYWITQELINTHSYNQDSTDQPIQNHNKKQSIIDNKQLIDVLKLTKVGSSIKLNKLQFLNSKYQTIYNKPNVISYYDKQKNVEQIISSKQFQQILESQQITKQKYQRQQQKLYYQSVLTISNDLNSHKKDSNQFSIQYKLNFSKKCIYHNVLNKLHQNNINALVNQSYNMSTNINYQEFNQVILNLLQ